MMADPAPVTGNTDEESHNSPWRHTTSRFSGVTDPIPSGGPQDFSASRNLTMGSLPNVTRQEDIQLLSHFRYHLSPWLDVNNKNAYFGVELLSVARNSSIIMATVLKLAAIHKSVMSTSDGRYHAVTDYQDYVHDFQNLLPREALGVQLKCRLLLKVGETLAFPLREWRRIASESNEYLKTCQIAVAEESLFLWCFRIGIQHHRDH